MNEFLVVGVLIGLFVSAVMASLFIAAKPRPYTEGETCPVCGWNDVESKRESICASTESPDTGEYHE